MAQSNATKLASSYLDQEDLSRSTVLSGDLIVGLVGYAGAGCTDVCKRLSNFLKSKDYEIHHLKLSDLISGAINEPLADISTSDGTTKLQRATKLQDYGDQIRKKHGHSALASMAIRRTKSIRKTFSKNHKAIIVDSFKHPQEIELFRTVYENSFRLVGVYAEKSIRKSRLCNKFYPPDELAINNFMHRDEMDISTPNGQQVRKAFHQADFFLDNSKDMNGHERAYDEDLERFVDIMQGGAHVRPSNYETAMYYAHAASLKSACLSRQVGAALVNEKGELISTGTNEVPAFGGGVYDDSHSNESNRCFKWSNWDFRNPEKSLTPCCHNTRKKKELKETISNWLSREIPERFAEHMYPRKDGELDINEGNRKKVNSDLKDFLEKFSEIMVGNHHLLDDLPGIGSLVEFSRSIHAEMDAILSAARSGANTENSTLFVTTYPCHNCARHLVAAGVKEVRFLEPYDKSLAIELHSDSIVNESEDKTRLTILPFTGVGPKVYDQYFSKRTEVKDPHTGFVIQPKDGETRIGVRLFDLDNMEDRAIDKAPENLKV